MSSIRFRCPNPKCRLTLHIPVQTLGRKVRCAGCGYSFLVPAAVSGKVSRNSQNGRFSKAA